MKALHTFLKSCDISSFENIFESAIFPIIITDANWKEGIKIIYVNRAFCASTGYIKNELIGKSPKIFQGINSNYKVLKELKTELIKGNSFTGESINYKKDGSGYYVQWSINPIRNEKEIIGYISYQKVLHKTEKLEYLNILNSLVETSSDIVVVTDLEGFIVYVNDAFIEQMQYEKEELIGKHTRVLKSGMQPPSFYQKMWDELLEYGTFCGVFISKKKDGSLFSDKKEIRTLRDEAGNPLYYVSSSQDITSEIEKQKNLEVEVYTDNLTQLYNRKKYNESINEMFDKFIKTKEFFSLILMDIDFFKDINDTYGHDIGDYILVELSKLLKKNTRQNDMLFRWGGEEFAIIVSSQGTQAYNLAEKLRDIISKHKFQSIGITASFGITQIEEKITKKELFNQADKSLYYAKNNGRNKVILYDNILDKSER